MCVRRHLNLLNSYVLLTYRRLPLHQTHTHTIYHMKSCSVHRASEVVSDVSAIRGVDKKLVAIFRAHRATYVMCVCV